MKHVVLAAVLLLPLAAWASARQDEGGDYVPEVPLAPDQLDEPSFLEVIGIMSMSNTRGERNNNPGNIRISSSAWMGKIAGNDAAFETFADPLSGIRALAKLLKNYQLRDGLRSVRQIIAKYAPASENNTDAYVRSVAAEMGVGADDAVDLLDDAVLERLTTAVIRHENGRVVYSQAEIAAAVRLA